MEEIKQKRNWSDKDERSEYMRKYCSEHYQSRKEILNSKMTCECGKELSVSSYKTHLKSQFHKLHVLDASERMEAIKRKILMNA